MPQVLANGVVGIAGGGDIEYEIDAAVLRRMWRISSQSDDTPTDTS